MRLIDTCRTGLALGLAAGMGLAASAAVAETRGVTDDTVRLGIHTDLSGVVAAAGTATVNALRMRFEEANEAGGVHGRMIELIVEDNQYQVPRAVQAVNKLINRDEVFAIIGSVGSHTNNAVLPTLLENDVPNLFPLAAAESMYMPFHKLKWSGVATYEAQAEATTRHFMNQGLDVVCVMQQKTDYGSAILTGVERHMQAAGAKIAAVTSHKPTDVDFSAAMVALKDAGCELIVLGTLFKDTVAAVTAARNSSWDVTMVAGSPAQTPIVSQAPGGVTEGLYVMAQVKTAYEDSDDPEIARWVKRYKETYDTEPNLWAQVGYVWADLTVKALERAGQDLTVESLTSALESIERYQDLFGQPTIRFGPEDHVMTNEAFLVQVRDGRWTQVTDTLPSN